MVSYIINMNYMKMNRFYFALLIIVLFVCTGAGASDNAAPESGAMNPVYKASNAVLSYFEPIKGTVTDVEDQLANVRFKEKKNIRIGMRLSAYREGETFYHPVTKEPIGKTESVVGRAEIEREIEPDGLYRCRIINGDIKTGDTLRIASSKTKLAFFQDRKADWGVSEAFYRALKDSGRFEIVESYTPSYRAEDLSGLAKKLEAEAVLMFSTPVKDEKKILSVKLLWASDAKLFGVIEEGIGHDAMSAFTAGEEFVMDSISDSGPLGSYSLPGGRLFAMGDVDGDGEGELIISDGHDIRIFDYKDGLKELWAIKGDPEDLHISIDTLDFNANGKAEIFVTSVRNWKSMSPVEDDDNRKSFRPAKGAIMSYVIEYDPSGGYRNIQENMPYFLRAMGKSLLMQKYTAKRIYSGPVFEAKWENGDYMPQTPLDLPDEVNIYGFTYVDWQNNGQRNVMTFNDHGLLTLYDNGGNVIWKGGKKYGIFELKFKSRTYSIANTIVEWVVRGRILSVHTERGQEVVVVKHVPYIENMPGFGGLGIKEVEVYSLWWDGAAMEEKVILEDVPGAISDYRVDGNELFLIARGDLFTFFNNATTGEFKRGSILYYYNFSRSDK